MLDITDFRELIVCPSLQCMGMWSRSAENLIMATALAESELTSLSQNFGGPALGVYQMEPETYKDNLRYLETRPDIKSKVLNTCNLQVLPNSDALVWHLRFATIMARLRYWMHPDKLPGYNDKAGMWEMYKKFYNSRKGKAEVDRFVELWDRHVGSHYA